MSDTTNHQKNKRKTQGHVPNYTDNTASRHDADGKDFSEGYLKRISIPFSRARFGVESKGFIGDVFNPPDGDEIDEN